MAASRDAFGKFVSFVGGIFSHAFLQEATKEGVKEVREGFKKARDERIKAMVDFLLDVAFEIRVTFLKEHLKNRKATRPKATGDRWENIWAEMIECAKERDKDKKKKEEEKEKTAGFIPADKEKKEKKSNAQRMIEEFNKHAPEEKEQIIEMADHAPIRSIWEALKKSLADGAKIKATLEEIDRKTESFFQESGFDEKLAELEQKSLSFRQKYGRRNSQ